MDAVEKAGILHRDISVGNIIIVESCADGANGMLIDWQAAKEIKSNVPRIPERSVRILLVLF